MVLVLAVFGIALMYMVLVAARRTTLAGLPVARMLDSAQIIQALKQHVSPVHVLSEQLASKDRAITERNETIAELEDAVRRQALEIDRLKDHVAILVENNALRVTAFAEQCEREITAKRRAEEALTLWNERREMRTPSVKTEALGYSRFDFDDDETIVDDAIHGADTLRERFDI